MFDLERLLKKYDCHVFIKKEDEQKVEAKPKVKIEKLSIWPDDFLPVPQKLKMAGMDALDYFEELSKKDLRKIPEKRLVKILSSIDLFLIQQLTAEDLISYTGKTGSNHLMHLYNFSKHLGSWLRIEFEVDRLFKMLKFSLELKNYNLINILIKSIQSFTIDEKLSKKLAFFRNMLRSQDKGIFPFEWLLQDCKDSNHNLNSEIASLRFCKIIEKLKEMKEYSLDFILKEKYKIIIFSKLYSVSKTSILECNKANTYESYLYLAI